MENCKAKTKQDAVLLPFRKKKKILKYEKQNHYKQAHDQQSKEPRSDTVNSKEEEKIRRRS